MKLTAWLKERELTYRRMAVGQAGLDRAGWLEAADHMQAAFAAVEERNKLRTALLSCARMAEALKRECSADPESPQAVRNAKYQNISTTAHIALGTIRGH